MTRQCWLVSDGVVLASAERADSRAERGRGLLGRDSIEGAMVFPGTKWVHTFGMKFALDVAYLDEAGTVVHIAHLAPHRPSAPVWKARTVIEAQSGAFERWGLHHGDTIEVRE
jgi:uncharacterized membrane protein (UPF0127 family)